MKVYLTGPHSNLYYTRESDWRLKVAAVLEKRGVSAVWSQRLRDYENFRESSAELHDIRKHDPQRLTFVQDFNELVSSSLLFVNFIESPHQPSLGSCVEIGRAEAWSIPIVAAIEPHSVHDHVVILEACDWVFTTLDEAVEKVISFMSEMVECSGAVTL